jgi:hypothetical protein
MVGSTLNRSMEDTVEDLEIIDLGFGSCGQTCTADKILTNNGSQFSSVDVPRIRIHAFDHADISNLILKGLINTTLCQQAAKPARSKAAR